MTDTFSIVLMTDASTTQHILDIRNLLPPAPLRDDTPHMTVLHTIKPPRQMTDDELLQNIQRILEPLACLPLTATVQKTNNIFSPLFGMTSQIQLAAIPNLKSYQRQVKQLLKANNYSVGLIASLLFVPYISVRLGVPYTRQTKTLADQYFAPGSSVTFTKWAILRDIKQDGTYLVRELSL